MGKPKATEKSSARPDTDLKCRICSLPMKNRTQELCHIRKVHNVKLRPPTVKCIEKGCSTSHSTVSDYRHHLATVHGFIKVLSAVKMTFNSMEHFQEWLDIEEMNTKASFFKLRGAKKFKNHKYLVYSCRRSGVYEGTWNGQKKVKRKGTCKIGHYCTCEIRLKIFQDSVEAIYFKAHHGHDNVPDRKPFKAADKEEEELEEETSENEAADNMDDMLADDMDDMPSPSGNMDGSKENDKNECNEISNDVNNLVLIQELSSLIFAISSGTELHPTLIRKVYSGLQSIKKDLGIETIVVSPEEVNYDQIAENSNQVTTSFSEVTTDSSQVTVNSCDLNSKTTPNPHIIRPANKKK